MTAALPRLVAGALAALALCAAAAEPAANKALNALFEREFKRALEENPELGTFIGYDQYNDRLTDHSPTAVARRRARVEAVVAELKRYDPAKLSTQDRISREVLLTDLALSMEESALYAGLPFGAGEDAWLPVSPMHGPQNTFAYLARAAQFRRARDYEDYLKRLGAIPASLEQTMETMRAGMKSGWMPPRAAMQRVPGMFAAFAVADVTQTALWKPFEAFPADVGTEQREALSARGRELLAGKVRPAFARMQAFLETEYLPASRSPLGASTLPAGPAFYALRVRQQTTTILTPAQIHEIGKSEVARIRGEMERVIASTAFKGSFAEFIEFLRTDPRFFFKTPEARLAAYRDIGKRADAELPGLFAELPRMPYGIRAMEAFEGDNADHYSLPAIDGSRAGFFEANVNNLATRPSHEMESTLLHEAVPGHHLQIARAMELKGLPLFRRAGGYNAYQEGWALYAESLGFEMGMYKDPYSHFGRLAGEMLRACRLVVDTGLHAFGWGREESIKYLAENSGYHPDFAAAEIDRYIVWPGQALGYKVGELKIKELRAKAKAALGDRFDVRRFHNALLDDGPLPLTVLEARIDEWIASQKR